MGHITNPDEFNTDFAFIPEAEVGVIEEDHGGS